MNKSSLRLMIVTTLLGVFPSPVDFQIPGIAEISNPREGEVLTGSVTIRGTADHPSFVEYELSFGYIQDDTGTWFPIGETVTNTVQDGRLAVWDTTRITDGEYRLRLTVRIDKGEPLTTIVDGLLVNNYSQSVTATPVGAGQILPTSTMLANIPTSTSTPDFKPPVTRGPNIGSSFLTGVILGSLLLVGIALYIRLRRDLLKRLSSLRTRRFHRRLDRERKRDGQ